MSQAAESRQGTIRGNCWEFGDFSGFGAGGLTGRLGMLKSSPINTGAAAVWRLDWALRRQSRPALGCLGGSL
jgi:hypothetical protein